MGYGPTTSERNEEVAKQRSQTMFLNGKDRTSNARTGRQHSQASGFTGRQHSLATREKMSKAKTGTSRSLATREKISKARKEAQKRRNDGGSQKKNASEKRRK